MDKYVLIIILSIIFGMNYIYFVNYTLCYRQRLSKYMRYILRLLYIISIVSLLALIIPTGDPQWCTESLIRKATSGKYAAMDGPVAGSMNIMLTAKLYAPTSMLANPGFEKGTSSWTLSGIGKTIATTNRPHYGRYSLTSALNGYSRMGQTIRPMNVFRVEYWFYVDRLNPYRGSVWGGVTNNPSNLNYLASQKMIGFNNHGASYDNFQIFNGRNFINFKGFDGKTAKPPAQGWYKARIVSNGRSITYSIYGSNGYTPVVAPYYEPANGYAIKAVLANINSKTMCVDDFYLSPF